MAANYDGQVNGGVFPQRMDNQEPGPAAAGNDATPNGKPRKTQKSVQTQITQLEKELAEKNKLMSQIKADIIDIKQRIKEANKELENMKKTAQKRRKRAAARKKAGAGPRQRAPQRNTNRVSPRRSETNPNQSVRYIELRGEIIG
ncbi:hypothetical protein HW555_006424 [Spodoptera exigua]|uniref:Uncharacterized protein n=1 Tax=Spodoptera exigua TaxID=7107 RepID=A0A835L3L1_SPOEX|nr:hypothetical protein HW555_006424 [Spodoptera exigua]